VWRDDGVPDNVPLFITESNISSQDSENSVGIFGALWLADYIGAFFTGGGDSVYYFHYVPQGVRPGCNDSAGSFGLFNVDTNRHISQPLSQFFASELINLEWLKPGGEPNRIFSAGSDIRDNSGHKLVTAYAAQHPDRQWAVMIVNKDQENAHRVNVNFHDGDKNADAKFDGRVDVITFGKAQYVWHPLTKIADPDGPPIHARVKAGVATSFDLPAASIVVLRGNIH